MKDLVTDKRIALLHPSLRCEVATLVEKANLALTSHSQMRIVQGYRTFKEQDDLYALGRTTKSHIARKGYPLGATVTSAKGGQSYHNYGLAIDFALLIDNKSISWDTKKDFDGDEIADWLEVVQVFIRAGWNWSNGDLSHFDKTTLHWKELLERYKDEKFISNINYISL